MLWNALRVLAVLLVVVSYALAVRHNVIRETADPSFWHYAFWGAFLPFVFVLLLLVSPFLAVAGALGLTEPSGANMWALALSLWGGVFFFWALWNAELVAYLVYHLFVPHPISERVKPDETLTSEDIKSTFFKHPFSDIGLYNRARKAKKEAQRFQQETEYYEAEEELLNATEKMARAQARVDELKKRRR